MRDEVEAHIYICRLGCLCSFAGVRLLIAQKIHKEMMWIHLYSKDFHATSEEEGRLPYWPIFMNELSDH
jgi:hypothetical protein